MAVVVSPKVCRIPAAQDVTLKELAFSYGEEPVFFRPEPDGSPRRYHRHHRPGMPVKIPPWPRVFLCGSALSRLGLLWRQEFSALTPRRIAATVGYPGP